MYRCIFSVREAFRLSRVLLPALLLGYPAIPVNLQARDRGRVTGSVTDAQGLALPGAAIVLRTTGRVFAASTVTDRTGAFLFDDVPEGDYLVAASLLGFSTHKERLSADPGVVDVDITLEVGSFSQEESLRVVRGPYALTWGAGTLSAIQAETFKPAFAGDFRLGGRAGYNYGSNGGADDGFAGLDGSSERIRFTFQHNTRMGGDYTDGNGDTVQGTTSRSMRAGTSAPAWAGMRWSFRTLRRRACLRRSRAGPT